MRMVYSNNHRKLFLQIFSVGLLFCYCLYIFPLSEKHRGVQKSEPTPYGVRNRNPWNLKKEVNSSQSEDQRSFQDDVIPDDLSDTEKKMKRRLKLLKDICSHEPTKSLINRKSRNLPRLKKLPNYLVHRERKFAWCMIYKGGSTSLIGMLLDGLLSNGTVVKEHQNRRNAGPLLHQIMPALNPSEPIRYKDLKSFINVRHPFSRLLSAYRDRILRNIPLFQKLYGFKIIRKYRKSGRTPNSTLVTPTFSEFVTYLLNTGPWLYNPHWRPYYLTCEVCDIGFRSILHTETFNEDVEHLKSVIDLRFNEITLHKTNLLETEKKEVFGETVKNEKSKTLSEEEKERTYYATITTTELNKLYNIFLMDFLLFNYTIYPYDTYVIQD